MLSYCRVGIRHYFVCVYVLIMCRQFNNHHFCEVVFLCNVIVLFLFIHKSNVCMRLGNKHLSITSVEWHML